LNFEQNRQCEYSLILTLLEKLKPLIVGVVLLHAGVRKVFYEAVEADLVINFRGEFSKHAFLLVHNEPSLQLHRPVDFASDFSERFGFFALVMPQ
jgi:hypothetical protein